MAPTINLGRRARSAIKIGGFVVLGLVAFVFALQATFDYDRVVKRYFIDALASSYDVTVGKVDRGILPGNFTLERVRLQARPTKADEVPPVMIIDKIDASAGIFALIGGKLSLDFDAVVGGGTLSGEVSFPFAGKAFKIDATGRGIKGDMIPQLRTAIGGLPLLGKLDLGLHFDVGSDWRKAVGSVTLGCPKGCTIGDGQTKFKPPVKSQRSATMMGEGIEWGRVDIDKLDAKAEFKDGKFTITKWDLQSRDAELHVELDVKLAKQFRDLEFTLGCFRYKALPALIERDPKTASAIAMVGGILGPDDLFHVKLEGTWATVKAKSKVCTADAGDDVAGTNGGTGRSGDRGDRNGPALTAVPADTGSAAHADPTGPQPGADINIPATPIDAAPQVDAAPGSNGSAGSATPGMTPGMPSSGNPPQPGAEPQQPPPPPPPDEPVGAPASERGAEEAPPPPPHELPPPVAPKENE